jgi:hypothetical protein
MELQTLVAVEVVVLCNQGELLMHEVETVGRALSLLLTVI